MNSVYKITNQINQKNYIGSSIRVEKRWAEHKNCAFNSNSDKYEYPLYQAFRKYGINNFTFKIIKNDFLTIEEMQKYEQEMIIKYNSLSPNGYNQTIETSSNNIANENLQKYLTKVSKQCALVNSENEILEIYPSYHAAARAQGWDGDNRASTIQKICEGKAYECNGLIFRLLDEDGRVIIPNSQTRKRKTKIYGVSINDPSDIVYYDSISEAARKEQADRSSISKCVNGSTKYSNVKGRIWRKEE